MFSNLDTYTGSARNYYIYHNLTTDKWEWIKWDGNESFGSYTNGAGNMISLAVNYHNSDRPLLERIFDNDNLYDLYLTEVCHLTQDFFNSAYMDNRIDEIKTLVQASVYADDNKMYSNADFNTNIESDLGGGPGPGGGATYGLKSFVDERSSYIDGVLDCSLYVGTEDLESININIYPNPASDILLVNTDREDLMYISMIDLQGKVVKDFSVVNSRTQTLDVSDVQKGFYLMQFIMNDGQVATFRLIKE